MTNVSAGSVLDIMQQYPNADRKCIAEIAIYRTLGVSSPMLEAVMIDTMNERNYIARTDQTLDIDQEIKPNALKKAREEFEALADLPDVAYERDGGRKYKNKLTFALWGMFKAGMRRGHGHLLKQGKLKHSFHIIGKIEQDENVFAENPKRHSSFYGASGEMERLGNKHPGTKFGVFTLVSTFRKTPHGPQICSSTKAVGLREQVIRDTEGDQETGEKSESVED